MAIITTPDQYNKVTYNGKTVHVFVADYSNTTGKRMDLAIYNADVALTSTSLLPSGVTNAGCVCKTNCAFIASGYPVLGLFRTGGKLYVHNTTAITDTNIATNTAVKNYFTNWNGETARKHMPLLCISGATATIRWFKDAQSFANAYTSYSTIIAGAQAVVYKGKNVFASSPVIDDDCKEPIAPTTPSEDVNACKGYHHLAEHGQPNTARQRTLLGFGNKKFYVAVVPTDSAMNLNLAANLMIELGCQYAINCDGGSSCEMWTKSGGTTVWNKVYTTQSSPANKRSAICFY